MEHPAIGVICKYTNRPETHDTSCMLRQEVLNVILDYRAIPVGIALTRGRHSKSIAPFHDLTSYEREMLEAQLIRCDGVIFQGGSYIANYECEAALFVHHKNIPALGFSSGQTAMAQIDAIEIVDVDPCVHQKLEQEYVHSARIVPDTLFHRIIGQDRIAVNSRHTKAIANCKQLKISAFDPEGNAEVIEDPKRDFYLATRFHPESLYQTDSKMDEIFKAFINAAHNYRSSQRQH